MKLSNDAINSNDSVLGKDIRETATYLAEIVKQKYCDKCDLEITWALIYDKYYNTENLNEKKFQPSDKVYYFIKTRHIYKDEIVRKQQRGDNHIITVSRAKALNVFLVRDLEKSPKNHTPGKESKHVEIPDTDINSDISYRGSDIRAMCNTRAEKYETEDLTIENEFTDIPRSQSYLFWYLMNEKYYKEYDEAEQPKVPNDNVFYFIKSPGAVINYDNERLSSIGKSYYLERDLKRSPRK